MGKVGVLALVALTSLLSLGCTVDSSLQCGAACAPGGPTPPGVDAGADTSVPNGGNDSGAEDAGVDAPLPPDDAGGSDVLVAPDTGQDGAACLPQNSPCNETGGTPCCSGDCSGSSGTHTCR